jgi:sugar phosphate permease
MGASLGFVGVLANTVLVSNWFRRLRGTVIGIVLTGTSLGGVLIPLVATPLITNYGWRAAMLAVSLIVWVILLPAVLFLVKNKPGDIGLLPDGDPQKDNLRTENNPLQNELNNDYGYTLGQALKLPLFWIFAFCAALIFYAIFAVSQQLNLYLQSPKIGFTPQQAGFVQSLLFALSIAGKFLFGFLSDRFPSTRVMLISAFTMFLSTLAFLHFNNQSVYLFVILFGLNYGGTFVLLQRLVADYFGLREYGKILGVITVIETLGAAIGGKITASLADSSGGDYMQAFYGVIIVTGLALMLVLLLNFIYKKEKHLRPVSA